MTDNYEMAQRIVTNMREGYETGEMFMREIVEIHGGMENLISMIYFWLEDGNADGIADVDMLQSMWERG